MVATSGSPPASLLLECRAWSHQPSIVRSDGGSIFSSSARPRDAAARTSSRSTLEDVPQALEPGLAQQACSAGPKPARLSICASSRHVEDVVRRRVDLVGEVLAARRRLGDLEQEAGREDALALEAPEVDRLDADQLVDRRHARMIGQRAVSDLPWEPPRAAPPRAGAAPRRARQLRVAPCAGCRTRRRIVNRPPSRACDRNTSPVRFTASMSAALRSSRRRDLGLASRPASAAGRQRRQTAENGTGASRSQSGSASTHAANAAASSRWWRDPAPEPLEPEPAQQHPQLQRPEPPPELGRVLAVVADRRRRGRASGGTRARG